MDAVLPARYRPRAQIGEGVFGEVWAALDQATGREVAIKVFGRKSKFDPLARRRFELEVSAAARLSHPNIVGVHDVVIDGAHAYLVMDLVRGRALADYAGEWPFPPSRFREIADGILSGLAYAHARGVVHRDLKPQNIAVEERAGALVPRILDFGTACLLQEPHVLGGGALAADPVAGTPAYMAPEQIRGDLTRIGPTVDLYALGVILYQLVTGNLPFDAPTFTEIAYQHLYMLPPALPPGARVPAGFEAIVRALLAKVADTRYELAAEVRRALAALDWEAAEAAPATLAAAVAAPVALSGTNTQTMSATSTQLAVAGTPPAGAPRPILRRLSVPPPVPPVTVADAPAPEASPLSGPGMGLFGRRAPPLVGRAAEQRVLWEAASAVLRGGRPRAVVLEGAAGVGKSRLVRWLQHALEEAGAMTAWVAVYHPEGDRVGGGLAGAVERALHLAELGEPEAREALADELARRGTPQSELAARVAAALRRGAGAAGGAAAARAALVDLLARCARVRGVLLALEDVQWAPPGEGLSLVYGLLAQRDAQPAPVLAVATLRTPENGGSLELRAELELLRRRDDVAIVSLGSLDDAALERLLAGLCEIDAPLRRVIAARSGGNPLFAIQLVTHSLESGAATPSGAGVVAPREGIDAEAMLPASVEEVCVQRVEFLAARSAAGADAARIAEIAALAGERVPVQVLEEVLGDPAGGLRGSPPEAPIVERLHQARQLLVAERLWSHDGNDGVRFEHRLLQESLAARAERSPDARALHRAFAGAWARWGELAHADTTEERARHLAAAGERAAALPLVLAVAARRVDEGRFRDAAHGYRRAQALLDDSDALRGQVELGLGRALEGVGNLPEAAALLARARATLVARGDTHAAAIALRHLGWVDIWRAEYAAAERHLAEAEAELRAAGDDDAVATCLRARCWAAFQTGSLDEAEARNAAALEIYAAAGNAAGRAWCLRNLCSLRLARGRHAEAQALAGEALALFRAVHEHNGGASVLSSLGDEALARCDPAGALAHFEAMGSEALAAGNDNQRRVALSRIAACRVLGGELERAIAVLDELAVTLSAAPGHWLGPTHLALRAWVDALAGRLEPAREALARLAGSPEDDPIRAQALAEVRRLVGVDAASAGPP